MDATRFEENPLLTLEVSDSIGDNINGPSVIEAPPWVDDPFGRYYMYFAHHGGDFVRVAYADDLRGPWTVYEPGTLHKSETRFDDHVASPDVHLDHDRERVRLYFHGCCVEAGQRTDMAVSPDGLSFDVVAEDLGPFYVRAFEHGDTTYALAKADGGCVAFRADGPDGPFLEGPTLIDRCRHTAVRVAGNHLDVFYSAADSRPERIQYRSVDLSPHWSDWAASDPETVLRPERDYEGGDQPLEESESGPVFEPVRQLRDPAVYETAPDERDVLFYSIAGERGIAGATLSERGRRTRVRNGG
jgi:hypothetical protein